VVISKIKTLFNLEGYNTISLKQYNSLINNILNQWQALTKLRAELEKRKERECFNCRKFGHLAHNCRNSVGEKKRKLISKNKFEVLASQVMQCGVRNKVKVRQQKREEKEVKYFRY